MGITVVHRFGRLVTVQLFLLFVWASAAFGQLQVTLNQISLPNLPAGSTVLFNVAIPAPAAPVAFQFSVSAAGGPFQVLRAYSSKLLFDWTPLDEGPYQIRVTARNPSSGETANSTLNYSVTSRVRGSQAAVNGTNHPLVALYSAPPCDRGTVRVRFAPAGGGASSFTPYKPCVPGSSVNFYVAGLYPLTGYQMQHEIQNGTSVTRGPWLRYFTGSVVGLFPRSYLLNPPDLRTSFSEGVVLQSAPYGPGYRYPLPVATDLAGQIIWYYDGLRTGNNFGSYMARPVSGGNQLLLINDTYVGEVLREIDLAGNTVRETNRTAVNQQLAAMGRDLMGAFHHDAFRLNNGHTLAVVSAERILTNTQIPGPTDVLADMVLDLDENMQVAWVFSSFDQLDTSRPSPLGELCRGPVDGCQQLFLGSVALDYTHTNTVTYSPADGNLILSMRHQDWVLKIDYRDGAGTGKILWRLGKDGDFTFRSFDPYPWFSHQHHVNLYDANILTVFDNGNTRVQNQFFPQSRGQVLRLDEKALTADLIFNQNVGTYSPAFGASGRLSNGNYYFSSGFINNSQSSQTVEYTPGGVQTGNLGTNTYLYRAFRMPTMYGQ